MDFELIGSGVINGSSVCDWVAQEWFKSLKNVFKTSLKSS